MSRILLPIASMLALATNFDASKPVPSSCDVEVAARSARVLFPSTGRTTWTWNRPLRDSAHLVPNYTWSLYLYPGPGLHFEISRAASGSAAHGTFAAMVLSGNAVVTWPSADPHSEFDSWRPVRGVRPQTFGDRLVLVIDDSLLVHELFYANHATESQCVFDSDFPLDTGYSVWSTVNYGRP